MIKSTGTHSIISRSHGLHGNAYQNAPALRDAGASISAFPRGSLGTRDMILVPTVSVGMPTRTLLRCVTLERLALHSHAGAWERGVL